MLRVLREIWRSFEFLVFPPICTICGQLQSEGKIFLCTSCFNRIIFLKHIQRCEKCSLPFTESKQCQDCSRLDQKFEKLASIFLYDGIGAEIMRLIKFDGKYSLLYNFIDNIKETVFQYEFDFVVPIPSYIKKFITRGYNTSNFIAAMISDLFSKPLIYALEKVREKKSQLELTGEERLKNPSDAFCLNPKVKSLISGKVALLADDIATTGATLSSCAEILKNEGNCKKVVAFSLARTPYIK